MRRLPIIAFANVMCIFLIAAPARADDQKPPPNKPAYETRAEHDPNGIGKFYMGREIAMVMGHEAAGWLDRPEREKEGAPQQVLEPLKVAPGSVVADVGAGSGYFSFRLAKVVGPKGKVLAVDIQPEMLELIKQRAKARKIENIELVLGKEKDPQLPADSVDLILMVDVYHEFEYPWEMAQAMVWAAQAGRPACVRGVPQGRSAGLDQADSTR